MITAKYANEESQKHLKAKLAKDLMPIEEKINNAIKLGLFEMEECRHIKPEIIKILQEHGFTVTNHTDPDPRGVGTYHKISWKVVNEKKEPIKLWD